MSTKVTNEQLGKPPSFLSQSYIYNGMVFTSGSVGSDSEGKYSSDVVEQTHQAIKNLEEVLIASGSSLKDVMKVLLFITNREDAAKINEVYVSYFPHKPARSCVMVEFPNADIKVELECVATVSK